MIWLIRYSRKAQFTYSAYPEYVFKGNCARYRENRTTNRTSRKETANKPKELYNVRVRSGTLYLAPPAIAPPGLPLEGVPSKVCLLILIKSWQKRKRFWRIRSMVVPDLLRLNTTRACNVVLPPEECHYHSQLHKSIVPVYYTHSSDTCA